ncbi:hypothetical protein VCRA2121O68_150053 [Vibrio crassostreae]|uniref:Uncharacterized protein n=1 Tax=Vibrio crassostreae TaxID=246167 RepID=A0ABM9QX51_9VIBR|nr:hypothetical protein VCRA2118O41_150088 [Vibrio crassostreae]CAK1793377.1 hypothetical protein VCRA2117O39_160052 [Vibrio crassostreae]CAK1793888.1 hypothetical protein VCRA2113O119_160051 [Vibrio crassostreae]CAK1906541.1 hypothetical protein VCRA2110O180_200091 [Vibrio crassostreae]CAK1916051.1 hypothetical protein VCRA2110O172_210046 [Vibrio crassostreae]
MVWPAFCGFGASFLDMGAIDLNRVVRAFLGASDGATRQNRVS